MGGAKRAMEEQQDRFQMGLALCIEVDAIEECEHHPGTYYQSSADLDDVYKFANAGVSAGRIKLPDRMSRRDLTDAIKAAYEDNSGLDYCSSCDKIARS
ncbi:hypothetical protein ACR9YC_04165 [Parasphingorhabdus sp. DH2-15]|uniref:hypothetical protein n=1 Tax=Parasphingorhabdus sp. DH2-15 TaxID=3444112 RepID=UPI003F6896BD